MSNTDPDLKPSEGNKPIGIDVVDGQLVIKLKKLRGEI